MRRLAPAVWITLLTMPLFGQLSSSAAVPISLRIPSSITLNLHSVPVSVNVNDGLQQAFSVPLQLNWNVDPREMPAFRVVAYFRSPQAALVETTSAKAISASDLMSRWGSREFLPFSANAEITLFQATIQPNLRHGHKQDSLELRISDEAASSLPDGAYQGVLYLEVRNY